MVYKLLADFVLLLHFSFIIFVIFGGLLALKNVKWAWLHIPAALWGSFIEFAGWICPLTPLENWLCFRSGASTYQESFIANYLFPLIYPTELTRNVQIILGVGVVLISLLIYSLVFHKRVRGSLKLPFPFWVPRLFTRLSGVFDGEWRNSLKSAGWVVSQMNREYENKNQSGQRKQYQPEDLSLKGYYAIAALSVTIGIVIVGILNLATPLRIITDRLALLSRFTSPIFLLLLVPPLLYLLLVYISSLMVLSIILRPISRYLKIFTSGGSLPEGLEEKAGRRLLNVPFIFIPAIVVGDVSGHGIPSALLMATARAFIRQRTYLPGGLSQVISDVNRQIVGDVEESGQFMTLFYMTVDQDCRCLEWVRAGHDPGIFYDPERGLFEDLVVTEHLCRSKEAFMTRLSLEDVMNLFGVQSLPGTPGQLERLRRWIECLVEKRGNTFVLENRRVLLDQWEQHMVLKTYDCC